ncbi:bifunctional metallophosphatase/5'-nucleotidase [Bacteroidota bacterium]
MKLITKKFFLSAVILSLLLTFTFCNSDNRLVDPSPADSTQLTNITILYTNDEHGWMEPDNEYGGAAGMMGIWRDVEGYTEDGPFLIFSGGDMWTGPALSTWFEGESMVEVMNAMGYNAAAIGNHEVDFGIDKLIQNSNDSSFPFLSANIVMTGTSNPPVWCQSYIIINVNNVSVGIIGLTTNQMPDMIFPEYREGLEFQSYDVALDRIVPQILNEGAELLIIISHMGMHEMRGLSDLAAQYGIALMGGGNTDARMSEISNGVTLIAAGSKMKGYGKAEILFNKETDQVISIASGYYDNIGGTPDAAIENIVERWQNAAAETLDEVIGYVNSTINQSSPEMYNLITDSWLYAYPNADISISNRGGVRQSIPEGEITFATIMGLLPFENNIVELELTGIQLSDLFNTISGDFFVGGITTLGWTFQPSGLPINDNETYKVLTTDYYYLNVSEMQLYDPDPYYSYVNWRQPLIDYIKSLNTSVSNPLDNYLDSVERQTPKLVFEY